MELYILQICFLQGFFFPLRLGSEIHCSFVACVIVNEGSSGICAQECLHCIQKHRQLLYCILKFGVYLWMRYLLFECFLVAQDTLSPLLGLVSKNLPNIQGRSSVLISCSRNRRDDEKCRGGTETQLFGIEGPLLEK